MSYVACAAQQILTLQWEDKVPHYFERLKRIVLLQFIMWGLLLQLTMKPSLHVLQELLQEKNREMRGFIHHCCMALHNGH